MSDVVMIHGYAHGDVVCDRITGRYGSVHAYGVLAARSTLAEVRWEGPVGKTEALDDRLVRRIRRVSGDLPRAPRPAPHRPAVPDTFPDGVRAPRVTPRKPRSRAPQTGTEHTCNGGTGPKWGHLTKGCPRCDELAQGHAPRTR